MEANGANTGVPTSKEGTTGKHVEEFKTGTKFWLALTPLLVIACMVSLDSTSVSVALPVSDNIRASHQILHS